MNSVVVSLTHIRRLVLSQLSKKWMGVAASLKRKNKNLQNGLVDAALTVSVQFEMSSK